jgi:hypothetical protein
MDVNGRRVSSYVTSLNVRVGEDKNPCLCRESNSNSPNLQPSHYTNWAVQTRHYAVFFIYFLPFGSKILYTLIMCSYVVVRDQVSHPF